MLTLDSEHGGVAPHALAETIASLDTYRRHIASVAKKTTLDAPECSVALPKMFEDFATREEILALRSPVLRYVVVVGIGGSNLGAMAIMDALCGQRRAMDDNAPKMFFLDTVSTTAMRDVASTLLACNASEEYIVIVISKSGITTETIANADVLRAELEKKWSKTLERFVAVTDEGSVLWERASLLGMKKVAMPKNVGGRYSVFSPVGLLPLLLAGVDVDGLLQGAARAVRECTSQGETNIALTSAAHTFLHYQHGVAIHNTFVFDPNVESVGKWYRQLMGESVGKEKDVDGNVVHCRILPIVSVGSTDLHSMAQRYFGGPRDIFTNIITVVSPENDCGIPQHASFSSLVPNIEGKSFAKIMQAIVGGVRTAYEEQGLPYIAIELPERNAITLGYYMQMRMIEMMYLAKLLNVNAFDQPAVELYKKGTRALLAQ